MDTLLKQVKTDHPGLIFKKAPEFYWSPREKTVYYTEPLTYDEKWSWTLLHEISHGLLEHSTFTSDFELLQLELAAWVKAKALAAVYSIEINNDHIEDCLDTYRDWLHKRSLCPRCGVKSLQRASGLYSCLNCNQEWRVSSNRLCRAYRASTKA